MSAAEIAERIKAEAAPVVVYASSDAADAYRLARAILFGNPYGLRGGFPPVFSLVVSRFQADMSKFVSDTLEKMRQPSPLLVKASKRKGYYMLNDQNPQQFRKPICLVGETVFYDQRYGINYALALAFKLSSVLHERMTFAYIAEPDWKSEQLPDKQLRLDRLRAFGCPFIDFPLDYGLSAFHMLRKSAEYIYAPALMASVRHKFSPKVFNTTKWVLESAPTEEARMKAFHNLADPYLDDRL